MQIAIRVDANAQIGLGHLMRCMRLAKRLRAKNAKVYFASAEEIVVDKSQKAGFECLISPQDIANLSNPIDWMILDHPELDIGYEQMLRDQIKHIMVIDDAVRPHDCDILLDPNPGNIDRYQGKVPENCQCFIGVEYAIIDEIFTKTSYQAVTPPRVTIGFGGSDPTSQTLKTLYALEKLDITTDIIIGAANPQADKIKLLAQDQPNWHCHHAATAEQIAHLFAKSTLAIGGGGTMMWEKLAIGTPAIEIAIAEIQIPILSYLHKNQHIKYIGWYGNTDKQQLHDAVSDTLLQPSPLKPIAIATKTNEVVKAIIK